MLDSKDQCKGSRIRISNLICAKFCNTIMPNGDTSIKDLWYLSLLLKLWNIQWKGPSSEQSNYDHYFKWEWRKQKRMKEFGVSDTRGTSLLWMKFTTLNIQILRTLLALQQILRTTKQWFYPRAVRSVLVFVSVFLRVKVYCLNELRAFSDRQNLFLYHKSSLQR